MVGEAFRLQGVVDVNTGPAERGLEALGHKVGGFGSTMALAFGTAAVAGVIALGAGIAETVTVAASFEKQISAISAVAGPGAASLDDLRATALQLGKDTSFSASEAAAGMEELVKAGVSIGDVMGGGARAALDLAAAGGLSVAEAATVASNAMNAFGLKGTDMAHIADSLAGASVASATDVHQLGFALASVGAVAHTIGLSFDDTTTAISLLAQAGLKGSDSGTSLKSMLLNLSPSTKKATAEFTELGIITADGSNKFFDAAGNIRGMSEIAGVLQESMAGLTKEQQINALQTMFGTDAIRAAAILAEAGAAGFDKMTAAEAAAGGAQAIANERLNNLLGSMEKLKGSLETGAIMIGSLFLPALKGMADSATDAVNDMMPLIDVWGPRIIKTLSEVMTSLKGLDWPTVLAAAKEVGVTLLEIFGGVVDWFRENWPLIQQTYHTVNEGMGQDNVTLVDSFKTTWGEMKSTVGTNMANIGDTIRLTMHLINGDWEGAWKDITTISERENQNRQKQAELHGGAMQKIIDNWTGGALTKFETWTKDVATKIGLGWDAVKADAQEKWSGAVGIAETIAGAWTTIQTGTATAGLALKNVLIGLWDLLHTEVIQPRLDIITGAVGVAWALASTKTHEVFDPLLAYVRDTIFEPIRSAVELKINAARDLFGSAVDAVSKKAHDVLDPILTYWRDTIWGPIGAAVDTAIYGPKGAHTQFESGVSSIKGIVDGTLQSIKSTWETVWAAITRAAESPRAAMDVIIGLVQKLKDIMPDWLIPHSPTPFQIGLEGIMQAAKGMDGAFGNMGGGLEGIARIAALATSIGGVDFGRAAAAISASETDGGRSLVEQGGTGKGPFQFSTPGELDNFARSLHVSLQEAAIIAVTKPMQAAAWALQGYLGDALRGVISPGLSGASLANYGSMVGQRPFGDFWKRAGEWYERLFPGMAAGGIVTRPTLALIGERGPEVVIPLSRYSGQGGGQSQTIRLEVAIGGRVAEEIVVTGYDLAVRRGRLPSLRAG